MLADQIKGQIEKNRAGDFESLEIIRGDLVGYAAKDKIIELFQWLRDDPDLKFNHLSMITAVDYLGSDNEQSQKRFEVVYSLYSISQHHRIMIKIRIDDGESVPSLTVLWDTANWQEREVYDMFGIKFDGHPDLTRILMDDDWAGFPQRKDFPLTYEDPAFSHNLDRIKLDDKTPGEEPS